jgi:hypothetical protein
MRKILLYLLATVSMFSAAMEQAHAVVIASSTFDLDAEGWTVGDVTSSTTPSGSAAPSYNNAGGNPGGYISTGDIFTNVAFFAPLSFSRVCRRYSRSGRN